MHTGMVRSTLGLFGRGLAEEAPFAYRDVDQVMATCQQAALATGTAHLRAPSASSKAEGRPAPQDSTGHLIVARCSRPVGMVRRRGRR
jgi:hypothetical protein